MKFHPYSEIFSLIEGDAFDELVADIKANGLREKIWIYDGKILDGRNRFLACQKAKVKPLTQKFVGNDAAALSLVWSINMHRRHLKEGQRAMAASKYKEILSANLHSGDATDAAAEATSVSRRSVFHADKVREKGSKALQKAVEDGDIGVSKAASVTDRPKVEQLAAAKAKKPVEADEPERPEWEPEEDEKLAAIERQIAESTDRVMRADDKLAAAHIEIKRQAAEIAILKSSRDHYQTEGGAAVRILKSRDRQIKDLKEDLAKARAENESFRERISIMEAA